MIRCKCSHRGKAETRFFRVLLAIIVWMILEGGLLRALAGEQDVLFWQDIGDVGAPFLPVEVLPMELGERFIPATGQAQAISFSYHAANHRYQLDGLWNDRGITKHLLEDKGMTQENYIQRFGFPAGRNEGGLTLTDSGSGIRYLYRAGADETALTEPEGYSSYRWQKSTDGADYVDIDTASAAENCFLPEVLSFGTTCYRCIATVAEQECILGEDYAVVYYRLPTARGLRIREVTYGS